MPRSCSIFAIPAVPPTRSRWDGGWLIVDGTTIVPSPEPSTAVLSSFDGGDASELFDLRDSGGAADPQKHPSALLRWEFDLTTEKEIDLSFAGKESFDAERKHWQSIADHVQIDIPAAKDLVDTVRANLAFNLLGRDGPAIRGGARNYRRSWIRDGSLASTALLRFGFNEQVRDYIRWFAQYQFADGKVPCCVDARGADPVAEHDSHGEFIYLVARSEEH